MALTVSNLGPGNYVLGGPGRLQGPGVAESIDLAQREEQRFRDAQRTARETEQAMQLRASAEQRAQQQFAMQQQQAATARAQTAQRRALMQQYGGSLVGGAPGLISGAPGVGVQVPAAGAPVTGGAETPQLGGGGNADLLGQLENVTFLSGELPQAGVDPRGRMQIPGVAVPTGAQPALSAQELLNAQVAGLKTPEQGRRGPIQGVVDFFGRKEAEAVTEREAAGLPALPTQAELAAQFGIEIREPAAEETSAQADEGPVVARDSAGLRAGDRGSPIDYVLGTPVGSSAPATNIPRDTPRISAAITQGFSERERLVEAYNAFTQAGLLDDAQNFLATIQKLDQTLIRLQGEQAINDLQLGSTERASQLLTYYYGADVQPVLTSDGVYDIYINGQPATDEDMLGLDSEGMGNMLRPFFDSAYQDAMAQGRETYLTEKAKKQAERDTAEQENPGFTIDRTVANPNGGEYIVMTNPAGEYRLVWIEVDEQGNPATRTMAITQEQLAGMGF